MWTIQGFKGWKFEDGKKLPNPHISHLNILMVIRHFVEFETPQYSSPRFKQCIRKGKLPVICQMSPIDRIITVALVFDFVRQIFSMSFAIQISSLTELSKSVSLLSISSNLVDWDSNKEV